MNEIYFTVSKKYSGLHLVKRCVVYRKVQTYIDIYKGFKRGLDKTCNHVCLTEY